jgi:hypothetical protein
VVVCPFSASSHSDQLAKPGFFILRRSHASPAVV